MSTSTPLSSHPNTSLHTSPTPSSPAPTIWPVSRRMYSIASAFSSFTTSASDGCKGTRGEESEAVVLVSRWREVMCEDLGGVMQSS